MVHICAINKKSSISRTIAFVTIASQTLNMVIFKVGQKFSLWDIATSHDLGLKAKRNRLLLWEGYLFWNWSIFDQLENVRSHLPVFKTRVKERFDIASKVSEIFFSYHLWLLLSGYEQLRFVVIHSSCFWLHRRPQRYISRVAFCSFSLFFSHILMFSFP